MQIKVKKGDNVTILSGKDRGKKGVIERVFTKVRQVVVSGINLQKKHRSARRNKVQAGIITAPAPIAISRVMVICPSCQKPTRVAITIDESGVRHRTCRKCHDVWSKKEQ